MEALVYLITAVASYLSGSVPTGLLVAKSKGIDIRKVGSGNIGATNAFRTLGRGAGTFVLVIDALKGFVPVMWFPGLAMAAFGAGEEAGFVRGDLLSIAAGLSAILGHNFPIWLRFRGGKGIATSGGVLIGLVPWALLIVLSIWIVVARASRYVSLASISAALCLPFAVWISDGRPAMVWAGAILGALAVLKHRGNIARLRQGTEPKIGAKKSHSPNPPSS